MMKAIITNIMSRKIYESNSDTDTEEDKNKEHEYRLCFVAKDKDKQNECEIHRILGPDFLILLFVYLDQNKARETRSEISAYFWMMLFREL